MLTRLRHIRDATQEAAYWASQRGGAFSDAQRLQLYALYKQATAGACEAPAPSRLDCVAHAKWCAARAARAGAARWAATVLI
jgi:acyl-CoA-binding protein